MIMLDNLPDMWDAMRRSITQSGSDDNSMTFHVLRNNVESELITRRTNQQTPGVTHALVAVRAFLNKQQSANRGAKRMRLALQRTPGATCGKCGKANHTTQQCGKPVDQPEQRSNGSAQMAATSNGSHRSSQVVQRNNTATSGADFDGDYGDDNELQMTTDCDDDSDDYSALASINNNNIQSETKSDHWLLLYSAW